MVSPDGRSLYLATTDGAPVGNPLSPPAADRTDVSPASGVGTFIYRPIVTPSQRAPVSDVEDNEMSDFSKEDVREMVKDKLEAVEARIDTKLAGIEGKIDRLVDAISASRADSQRDIGGLAKETARLATEVRDVRSDNKNTRWTIGVTIAVALLAALGALWTTQANLLSSFSAGLAIHESASHPPTPAKH
jgi:hypothetical protein